MKKRLEGDRTRSTLFLALFQLRPLQSEEVPHLVEHRELHLSLKPFFSATGALNRPLKQRYPVRQGPLIPHPRGTGCASCLSFLEGGMLSIRGYDRMDYGRSWPALGQSVMIEAGAHTMAISMAPSYRAARGRYGGKR